MFGRSVINPCEHSKSFSRSPSFVSVAFQNLFANLKSQVCRSVLFLFLDLSLRASSQKSIFFLVFSFDLVFSRVCCKFLIFFKFKTGLLYSLFSWSMRQARLWAGPKITPCHVARGKERSGRIFKPSVTWWRNLALGLLVQTTVAADSICI